MQQFRGQEYQSSSEYEGNSYSKAKTKPIATVDSFSAGKVLMWLGIGLLITGLVSLGFPDLLQLIAQASDPDTAMNVYTGFLVASAVLIIPSIAIIHIQSLFKNKGLMITSYVFYTIFVGIFLSSLFLMLFVDEPISFIRTLSISFLSTAGIFLLFGFLGTKMKGNHIVLWAVLAGLVQGAFILSLVNFFIGSSVIYWIISFILLAYMLLIVSLDFHHVKQLAKNSYYITNGTNLAIYCAYYLYTDFVYIFIQILSLVASISSRKK